MAYQLGLTGGLLLNNRRDEVADGFELMPVCPGQEKRDIIAQTSRERVVRCHTQRLSQGLSSCLLVTSENVSRHQVPHRSLRQRLPHTLPTKGQQGSRKKWKPVTPAMAAGLTDHGWTMDELLSFRVPP